jgi:hypothetical protein
MLEFPRPQDVLDLTPPVFPALQRNEILPEGEVFLFQRRAKVACKSNAIVARIGDKSPARMIAVHRARRGFAHSIRVFAARNAQAPRLKRIEFLVFYSPAFSFVIVVML